MGRCRENRTSDMVLTPDQKVRGSNPFGRTHPQDGEDDPG